MRVHEHLVTVIELVINCITIILCHYSHKYNGSLLEVWGQGTSSFVLHASSDGNM